MNISASLLAMLHGAALVPCTELARGAPDAATGTAAAKPQASQGDIS